MIKNETRFKATNLLLDIEKHFANGGGALTMRDISRMVGLSSSAAAQQYVNILLGWGVIKHNRKEVRTIVLADADPLYPPIEYRKDIRRVNT